MATFQSHLIGIANTTAVIAVLYVGFSGCVHGLTRSVDRKRYRRKKLVAAKNVVDDDVTKKAFVVVD